MKTISLKRLSLENFQGGTFTIEPNGEDTDVYGDNGTGKTRLFSAFTWLLFGKDSLGRSDFDIKNKDLSGAEEHGIDHAVEGVFEIDGTVTTLKKVYREVYTKRRGNPTPEMTGHTTDHWIDGVPVKEGEYKTRIGEIAGDENIFRLLTNPSAFPSLPWQKQRSLILDVCGTVTDAEVIETDPVLAPLTELLKKYTASKTPLDDLKKVVVSRRKEINEELEKIPVRIDEVRRGLPDITGLDRKEAENDVALLERMLSDAQLRLQGIDSGGRIADLSKQLQGINNDIVTIQNGHFARNIDGANKLSAQILEIKTAIETYERRQESVKAEIEEKQKKIEFLSKELEKLKEKWHGIRAEEFQDTTEDTCPACGQPLPADRVEGAREKALAEFNRSKSERLEENNTRGKSLKAERDRLVAEIEDLTAKAAPELISREDELQQLIMARDAMKATAEDYNQAEGWGDLQTKKTLLEGEIRTAREGTAEDQGKIKEEIEKIQGNLVEAKLKADIFPRREQGEKRIEELKGKGKVLSTEFEEFEKQLFLIDTFTKKRVSMHDERINTMFELVRFKLFNQLVNGGIEDCCEMIVGGIGYNSGLNSAARTNGGLDVCRTMARHYRLLAPIFVDNAESVTELIKMDCQVIRLVVSEKDKALRVETRGNDSLFGRAA